MEEQKKPGDLFNKAHKVLTTVAASTTVYKAIQSGVGGDDKDKNKDKKDNKPEPSNSSPSDIPSTTPATGPSNTTSNEGSSANTTVSTINTEGTNSNTTPLPYFAKDVKVSFYLPFIISYFDISVNEEDTIILQYVSFVAILSFICLLSLISLSVISFHII